MKKDYNFDTGDRVPLKMWTRGVPVDSQAKEQLVNLTSLPFIHKHIAVMPDVHGGIGSTIGSVIPTKGAIVPAAVGVDIGCGMMAVQTNLTAHDLPDSLFTLRSAIEAVIPHGRSDNGGKNDVGSWQHDMPPQHAARWKLLADRYTAITNKHPKAQAHKTAAHMGTLGTGNHFIEVCLDEADQVWVMLHSGSRGPGNRIGSYFIELAKKEMDRYFIGEYLPDRDLAYLVEHTEYFDDYVTAVHWAQDFATQNREAMMLSVLSTMGKVLRPMAIKNMAANCHHKYAIPPFDIKKASINCHHNYVEKENHFGANVWVTRKGAVRARSGELGIIPGSMGAKSFIVRGKGNPESFHSCSHGAGRVMSRTEAKKTITLGQHMEAMQGIEARLDADILDESPAAYKDINAVMAAQESLIEIVHTLRQIVNVKG